MKTTLTLLSLALFLPLFATAQMQPITISFDYVATNIYAAPTCGVEGDGVHCLVAASGASVNSSSDDEWPSQGCATIDYNGPVYHFPSPAGPFCGTVDNEGVGTATFSVPAGVAVTDPQGNVLGATNSGGTVVITTVQPGRYVKLKSVHFVNVMFTPGAVPNSAPVLPSSSSVSPANNSPEGCASREDAQSHEDLHSRALPDVTFELPSGADMVIDPIPNCTGEDYKKQPCWRGEI